MSDDNMDVLVAAYLSVDDAERDFEALLAEITAKRVKVDSAIVVVKDPDGTVSVRDTGDKAGRKGAKWGAGVGLLVGLAALHSSGRSPWVRLGARRWARSSGTRHAPGSRRRSETR